MDRPIIFSAPMVQALLREAEKPGTGKTMTRRLAWRKPKSVGGGMIRTKTSPWWVVKSGDRLWVRESLQRFDREPPTAQYIASMTGVVAPPGIERHPNGAALWQWRNKALPSIHMPRWASRLTLVVSATKTERLQEISEKDARAEGVEPAVAGADETRQIKTYRTGFVRIWRKLHGEESWLENPEVVALTFTVHKTNIDAMPKAEAA